MVHSTGLLLLHGGLFLAPCGAVLTCCALSPSLFALHPAANALAFLVCFPAGVFAAIERKETSNYSRRMALVKTHAGFQSMVVVLMGVGGAAAFLTKESLGKPHLTSPHSRLAAATTAFSLLNTLGGVVGTFFSGKTVNWQWKNPGHRISGTIAFVLGGTTAVLGVYSGSWGTAQLGPAMQWPVAASVGAGYVWLLARAITAKPPSRSR